MAMTNKDPQKIRGGQNNNRSDIEDLVRRRIDELISQSLDDDYASVSNLLGKNHAYMQQYIKRRTPRSLKEEDRRMIAEHFKVSPESLYVGGTATQMHVTNGNRTSFGTEGPKDNLVQVRVLFNPASVPSAPSSDHPFDQAARSSTSPHSMAFSPSFLTRISGTCDPEILLLSCTRGSTMAPTLNDGDTILIKADREPPRQDGIYALYSDGQVIPKRVMVHPDGRKVTLTNDNPLYSHGVDCQLDEVEILGRIVWCGRQL
jgi:hypothetical protein